MASLGSSRSRPLLGVSDDDLLNEASTPHACRPPTSWPAADLSPFTRGRRRPGHGAGRYAPGVSMRLPESDLHTFSAGGEA